MTTRLQHVHRKAKVKDGQALRRPRGGRADGKAGGGLAGTPPPAQLADRWDGARRGPGHPRPAGKAERWCQAHGSCAGDESAELPLLSTRRRGPGVEGELPDFHEGAQPTGWGGSRGATPQRHSDGIARERQMGDGHTTPRASTHPNKARRQYATGQRHVMHALQRKVKKTRHTDPRGRSM